jgi:hypothetical protein
MWGQRLRWALWTVAAVLLLLYVWREYWSDVLTVSYADYCQVQMGMNPAEVASVLGGPATYRWHTSWISPKDTFTWEGCAGSAIVEFDEAGKVVNKCYWPRVDWDNADPVAKERLRREWRRYRWQRVRE